MQRCCNNQYLLFARNWTSQSHVLSCWPRSFWPSSQCTADTKVSFRHTYDKCCHFAKWLCIRSVCWQRFAKLSISRWSFVQATGQRAGRCWLGTDAEKQQDNVHTCRSSLASESSSISIRRWWLDVCQSFSSGRLANVSAAETDRRGKACEKVRLCILSVCVTVACWQSKMCCSFTLQS